jgi:hypothetical protein
MAKLSASLAFLSLTTSVSAFHVPKNQPIIPKQLTTAATTAAIAITTSPLLALAEQDDDYVYGAVAVSDFSHRSGCLMLVRPSYR